MKKLVFAIFFMPLLSLAQTDIDGIMMSKQNLCIGPTYSFSNWNNYWEGETKRDNKNLGTFSSSSFAIMGNYGFSKKINLLFALPYISNKVSNGQLKQTQGLQDLSLWIKYEAFSKKLGNGFLSFYTIGGLSTPINNYVADYLPLSIGLQTTNASFRGLLDYEMNKWFATLSTTYIARSNLKIDRDAYYTTRMHYSNVVEMPNAMSLNLRFGYRHNENIAEFFLDDFKTLGGFDISKNNMPFPSNRMNATRMGFAFKYNTKTIDGLSVIGNYSATIAGRNVGQSFGFTAGLFYILDFTNKNSN